MANKSLRRKKKLNLKDAVELMGGVVVEEEGQAWPDGPHRVPVPGRQPCTPETAYVSLLRHKNRHDTIQNILRKSCVLSSLPKSSLLRFSSMVSLLQTKM